MSPYASLYDDSLQKFCASVREDRIKEGDQDGEAQLQHFLSNKATMQQVRDSAADLQQETSRKYSSKKIGDKEIISQKWIDNILGNVGNAITIGDNLLHGTPESVGMAWFCVKLGLNAIQSNHQLYSLFGSGLTSMTEIMILIPHYSQLYDERQKSDFKSNEIIEKLFRDVVDVYVAVLDFLFAIKRHVEARTLATMRHAFKDIFGAEVLKSTNKQENIVALKAKVIEDSDLAFQQRLFDQLGDVQRSLKVNLDTINTFASTAKELARGQTDILRELQELKTSVKPKTRWEWSKQEFDVHKKTLDPLPEIPGVLQSLSTKRHPGTTQWIYEHSRYITWSSSRSSALLCLIGQEAAGKSVMLASVADKFASTTDHNSTMICFSSCKVASDAGADPAGRVLHSMIYQVYKHAAEDEGRPDLLEECNKLFHHPKADKRQQLLMNRTEDGSLPGFSDSVVKVAQILQKDVLMLVDDLDTLTAHDQNAMFNAFKDVIDRSAGQHSKVSVRILASCRSNESFAIRAFAQGATVDIAEGNSGDMALQLAAALTSMPDWTAEERGEAQAKVLSMAGSRFGYISAIAIPFLQQPFQRPLTRRLEHLPEGATDSYRQALQSTPSNYLDLLRTALMWTLYSTQPVRVKEVMEDFSGVYDAYRDADVPSDYTGLIATELEMQQLQGASGPFLKTTPSRAKQQIVAPQDVAQIRKFCDKTDRNNKDTAIDEYCARCRAHDTTTHSITLSEKQVHLDLALKPVRHLNSPLFQRRFKLLPQRDSKDAATETSKDKNRAANNAQPPPVLVRGALTGPEVRALRLEGRFLVGECASNLQEDRWQWSMLNLNDCLTNFWGKIKWATPGNFVLSCRNIVLLDGAVLEAEASDTRGWHRNVVRLEERIRVIDGHLTFVHEQHGAAGASVQADGRYGSTNGYDKKDGVEASSFRGNDKTSSIANVEDFLKTSGPTDGTGTKDESMYDSDDSAEDEDHGDVGIVKKMRGQVQSNNEEGDDHSGNVRYEILQWPHHFREADRLWSDEEKARNPQWTELMTELDKFAIDNVRTFDLWQQCMEEEGDYLEQGVGPLHVAAHLGLTHWARHLVKARGMDPSEFSSGRNALQAAAISADRLAGRDMLEFLLKIPGADAVVVGTSNPREPSALQEWLWRDPSTEAIKLFIDHGVDMNKLALHAFAASMSTDTAALKLILDSGGTERRPRPDINAKDNNGNTPLHFLMTMRNVPVELLKEFIAHGANIDAENDSSLRPLQSACSWSDPELVEIFLDSGISDINDRDIDGLTALHAAASVGSTACVRLLISHNANVGLESNDGRKALHLAAQNGHKDTVETLIESGANLNDGDRHARTPFWFACNGASKETAVALLAALKPRFPITKINQPSQRGRTPFRMAATHGFLEICEDLIKMTAAAGLDNKAMIDSQDTRKEFTALHRAAWRGELSCVRLLLQHDADGTLKDLEGNTPIMLATNQWQMTGETAFEEIVFALIDTDQEQVKLDSELPATAASNGSVRVLEKLHRIGADINKADRYGWTPLSLAKRLQYPDVERYLKHQAAWGGTLPSAWVPHTAIAGVVDVNDNGLEIVHESGTQCTISTDKPLPAGLDRYYFEVTSRKLAEVKQQPQNPFMGIGFCTLGAQYYEFPGCGPKRNSPSGRSWAYHGDDGGFYAWSDSSAQSFGELYGPGDTIGCGVDLETRKLWYTKNGKKCDYEHEGVSGRLFPIIGLQAKVSLETNFGGKEPFVWTEANAIHEV